MVRSILREPAVAGVTIAHQGDNASQIFLGVGEVFGNNNQEILISGRSWCMGWEVAGAQNDDSFLHPNFYP